MAAAPAARAGLGLGGRGAQTVADLGNTKVKDFFREVCRCLPWIARTYKLDELTDVPILRANVSKLFRQHGGVTSPNVTDLLIYKGREELEMIMMQHKQRHHLVTRYVHNPALDRFDKPHTYSPFLDKFYKSN